MKHNPRELPPPPSEWNEKQTENYVIEPLIDALGFNLRDPRSPERAQPEYDRGVRSSSTKVDYALFLNSQPVMLVECKQLGEPLDKHVNQLDEYFRAPGGQTNTVKIGILSNGDEFRFYTDSKDPNVMDPEPYWTFKLSKFSDGDVETLLHYTVKNLTDTLNDLPAIVYASRLKRWLVEKNDRELDWLYRATAKEIKTGARMAGEDVGNAEKIWTLIFPDKRAKDNLSAPKAEEEVAGTQSEAEEVGQKISLADFPKDASHRNLKILSYEFDGEGARSVKTKKDMFVGVITTLCEKYDLPNHFEKEPRWFRHKCEKPSEEKSSNWAEVTNDCEVQSHSDLDAFIRQLKEAFEAVGISESQLSFNLL